MKTSEEQSLSSSSNRCWLREIPMGLATIYAVCTENGLGPSSYTWALLFPLLFFHRKNSVDDGGEKNIISFPFLHHCGASKFPLRHADVTGFLRRETEFWRKKLFILKFDVAEERSSKSGTYSKEQERGHSTDLQFNWITSNFDHWIAASTDLERAITQEIAPVSSSVQPVAWRKKYSSLCVWIYRVVCSELSFLFCRFHFFVCLMLLGCLCFPSSPLV